MFRIGNIAITLESSWAPFLWMAPCHKSNHYPCIELHRLVLPLLELHINGFIRYIPLGLWLFCSI